MEEEQRTLLDSLCRAAGLTVTWDNGQVRIREEGEDTSGDDVYPARPDARRAAKLCHHIARYPAISPKVTP